MRVTSLKANRIERGRLVQVVRQTSAPAGVVVRARIVLLATEGRGTAETARLLRVCEATVRKWKARWRQKPVLESLFDSPRSGRPLKICVASRCEVVALACSRPADHGVAYRDTWTLDTLTKCACSRLGVKLSRSSVQRVLSAEGLRPHRVRVWLHSPDPAFRPKVRAICALYASVRDGRENAVVLCLDEKPLQVLGRLSPTHAAPDGCVRWEYEYVRRGTQALLGALDVRTGKVHAQVVPHRDADALVAFVDRLLHRFKDRRVVIVWDNLNIHYDGAASRWTRLNARHGGRLELRYTPLHASWVNQVEVWFSILQRRVLRYGDFATVADQRAAVLGFVRHWNRFEAHPFNWTFSGRFVDAQRAPAA